MDTTPHPARTRLAAGESLPWWQVTPLTEHVYDVPEEPMEGEMDSTFFLTRDKNIIPHTYPCRTAYIAQTRDKMPEPDWLADWSEARNVLPMGSAFLDLSNFWYRATALSGWARTAVRTTGGGPARVRLGICGAARLYVNGESAGWLAPATRNALAETEIDITLRPGVNELTIWFQDLAERDAVLRVMLTWLSGPEAQAAYPYDAPEEVVAAVEHAIADMHLDRHHYDDQEVWLVLPTPFPDDVAGTVRVAGHFMSHDSVTLPCDIPAGATRVRLDDSAALASDFRYFHFHLDCAGFRTSAVLGAEMSNARLFGPPPATLPERIDETLRWIAENAEGDAETALACLDVADDADIVRAAHIIEEELPGIERCHDCADFALVPLIWARIAYADRIATDLHERIDAALLDFRYWMDEPGNDVQWYFSENHALLLHSCAYLAGQHLPQGRFHRSGRNGREQNAVGRERLMAWFDHFETAEMAEFNSATYFPIDLKGLTALQALAVDAEIRSRAQAAIARLLTIVANSCHHGRITAAQGRSYEHSLCVADTGELTGVARLLWGVGAFGAHVNCLAQLALALRDHALEVPDLAERAAWTGPDALEWMFWQGKDAFARLYHHKTAETALGSAALYRWGDWGYQETLIHARIGRDPRAQLWINHPGEMVQSGFGRPSFWGGSASVPRVQQYRDLAIVVFGGTAPQLNFTHAWFPTEAFDDWRVEGDRASARCGSGLLTLQGSGPLVLQRAGGSAGAELRLAGRDGLWVLRLGQGEDLAAFEARHPLEVHREEDGTFVIRDADYGEVVFAPDGIVEAEGRRIDPRDWTLAGERRVIAASA